jgi:hypothetical protein
LRYDICGRHGETVLSQDERMVRLQAHRQLERVSTEKRRAKQEHMAKLRKTRGRLCPDCFRVQVCDTSAVKFIVLWAAYI